MKLLNVISAIIGTAALTTGLIYLSNKKEVKTEPKVEVKVLSAGLQQSISPPIESVDVKFTTLQINPLSDTIINFPNGTIIEIPEGAFVDKDGNPVTENVTIKYREFHTPGDVIASGIPMKYDSAGIVGDFESAGMFEIRGSAKGEEVFIGDKPLAVNLASFKGGSFNQYRLNDDENNWTYLGKSEPKINLNREKLRKELKKAESDLRQNLFKPQKVNKVGKIFSMNINKGTGTIKPYMTNGLQPLWEFVSSNVPGGYKGLKKLTEDKHKGISVSMDSTEIATIVITDKNYKELMVKARPVFLGDDYDKARRIYDNVKVKYGNKKSRIKKLTLNVSAQARFKRLMGVKRFGVYNCDILMSIPFSQQYMISLLKDGAPLSGTYNLVTTTAVIPSKVTNGRALTSIRKDGMSLFVTLTSDGKLYYADKDIIKKALDSYEGLNTIGGYRSVSIEVKEIPYKITSSEVLNEAIDELTEATYSRS